MEWVHHICHIMPHGFRRSNLAKLLYSPLSHANESPSPDPVSPAQIVSSTTMETSNGSIPDPFAKGVLQARYCIEESTSMINRLQSKIEAPSSDVRVGYLTRLMQSGSMTMDAADDTLADAVDKLTHLMDSEMRYYRRHNCREEIEMLMRDQAQNRQRWDLLEAQHRHHHEIGPHQIHCRVSSDQPQVRPARPWRPRLR